MKFQKRVLHKHDSEIYKRICETETHCDNCGKVLKPFEGMLNDLCSTCTKNGVESNWDKIREVAGK